MAQKRSVSVEEIQKHASPESCWSVVDGVVWDLTEFAPEHPGGSQIIYQYAGRDASEEYNAIHAPSVISENLDDSKCLGRVDESSIKPDSDWLKPPPRVTTEVKEGERPPLETIINSYDFEEVASRTLNRKTWAFYSSAATDLITKNANNTMLDRIWLRPRILRNVRDVSTETRVLGHEVQWPLFVSPAALAKLAHPEGEKAIARACNKHGIAQCISTNASFPMDEIPSSAPDVPIFFQLYVNKNRAASEKLLNQAEECGVKGILVTVDAPVPGKREADERVKADAAALVAVPMSGAQATNDAKGGGIGRTMGGYIDATLNWEDIAWLRRSTRLPLVLKGIQTAADATIAVDYGLDGIFISNHGGRNLDTSPPAILTLLEIRRLCPQVFGSLEVLVDCGFRRGTDIFKALCLGATAVGIGRHFLYALNYGQAGVEHLIGILRDEFETTMRMVGITDLSQLHPGLLNTLDVDHLIPRAIDGPILEPRRRAKL